MSERVFVFVVCGAKEHIDTLHYSLKCLKRFFKHKIIVLTDSSRNEISIAYDSVIDIKTPEEFNHHQASIFLKTGIYQFLPKGNLYCYLDTDVVALSEEADTIFGKYNAPVTFAPDHSRLNDFSPFAIQCDCITEKETYFRANELYHQTLGLEYNQLLTDISQATEKSKQNFWVYFRHWLRYHFSPKYYVLTEEFLLEKKSQRWLNKNGEYLDEKYSQRKFIEDRTGLQWNEKKQSFVRENGTDILSEGCTHLHKEIKKEFGISIPENWQQWNGGVFLFDDQSHDFLEFWHKATLDIFKKPRWKTRDQGTLVATVWKFGLQHQPLLDVSYNFIVDYNKPKTKYAGDLTFQTENETFVPVFAHIFYHFGDSNWDVWQDVEKCTNIKYQASE